MVVRFRRARGVDVDVGAVGTVLALGRLIEYGGTVTTLFRGFRGTLIDDVDVRAVPTVLTLRGGIDDRGTVPTTRNDGRTGVADGNIRAVGTVLAI